MKLSELQISYLHRHTVSRWMLERWRPWIIYLYLSYINYFHTRPQTQVYKPLFPAFYRQFLDFSPYEQHIFVHDKSSFYFLGLADLSIFLNNAKHRHLEFLLLISMEKKEITSCPAATFRATAMTSCASNQSYPAKCNDLINIHEPSSAIGTFGSNASATWLKFKS